MRISAIGLIVTLAFGLLTVPLRAEGQQAKKVYRIGWVDYTARGLFLGTFTAELRDLGWVDGKDVLMEYRGGDGTLDSLPNLVRAT